MYPEDESRAIRSPGEVTNIGEQPAGDEVGKEPVNRPDWSEFDEGFRRILPALLNAVLAANTPSTVGECDDIGTLRAELEASRCELERIRNEKTKQERDILIKEHVRSLGVHNVELALRATRDDIVAKGNGEWVAYLKGEEVPALQFLKQFVGENPELIPARGVRGVGLPARTEEWDEECDLDQIRPGMDSESLRRAREAVVRIIAQGKRTL